MLHDFGSLALRTCSSRVTTDLKKDKLELMFWLFEKRYLLTFIELSILCLEISLVRSRISMNSLSGYTMFTFTDLFSPLTTPV